MTNGFTFERSTDWNLIKRVLTDPSVWGHISDDTAPERESYEPLRDPALAHYVVRRGETLLGLWVMYSMGNGLYEIHTCLLPEAAGQAALAGRAFAQWCWKNIEGITAIRSIVPVDNRLALALAKGCGMVEYKRETAAIIKHGTPLDAVFLELKRPECHS